MNHSSPIVVNLNATQAFIHRDNMENINACLSIITPPGKQTMP